MPRFFWLCNLIRRLVFTPAAICITSGFYDNEAKNPASEVSNVEQITVVFSAGKIMRLPFKGGSQLSFPPSARWRCASSIDKVLNKLTS